MAATDRPDGRPDGDPSADTADATGPPGPDQVPDRRTYSTGVIPIADLNERMRWAWSQ